MEKSPNQSDLPRGENSGKPAAPVSGFGGWLRRQFRTQLKQLFQHHIPAGERILDLGCRDPEVLEALNPSAGLGIVLESGKVDVQAKEGATCEYRQGDPQKISFEGQYDSILLNYTCGRLPDIQSVLEHLQGAAHARTRLYATSVNTLWVPLVRLARRLGLTADGPPSNWLSHHDYKNFLELAGWELIQLRREQLLPLQIPLLTTLFNRWLVRLPLLEHLGLTIFMVARPRRSPRLDGDISCSVVVPARNESGHIRAALDRIPVLGRQTEVIFVEGNSTDDTWEVIQREVEAYDGPHQVSFCQQPGKGKWDAVFTGFARARGDVLVIQDGDLTAPPEDLPKFFNAIERGDAEFANGSRLVYPMEKNAMRFLNLLGNKFFAGALTFVLRQPIKDSLCGTKMMLREDYLRLLERIRIFGDFDPFGDFNLLFGSSLLNLKIRDVPVRYLDRLYGDTNISRFSHGWVLIRMTWFALRKLRFHSLKVRR